MQNEEYSSKENVKNQVKPKHELLQIRGTMIDDLYRETCWLKMSKDLFEEKAVTRNFWYQV